MRNGGVDLLHQLARAAKGDNDLLVVAHVVEHERPPAPILQPLFTDLVAANRKVPDLGRHTLEILRFETSLLPATGNAVADG